VKLPLLQNPQPKRPNLTTALNQHQLIKENVHE
jgi:hypothetical protein